MPHRSVAPILVVDDEPDIRDMLKVFLTRLGYRVTVAENGLDGFNKALVEKPRLLITDLAMPVQDGSELVYAVRKTEKLKGVPIIVMSAIDSDIAENVSNWVEADYFLRKPCELSEVERVVKLVLSTEA